MNLDKYMDLLGLVMLSCSVLLAMISVLGLFLLLLVGIGELVLDLTGRMI